MIPSSDVRALSGFSMGIGGHVLNRRSALWVITSYFNPVGYRRRLLNYRRFRSALGVPLAAVELSFTGSWELADHDADLLLRVADGDVMWQKERLLNLVVAHLPPECEYVAWIDADVLMQDADWPEQAVAALASVPLVQLFSEAFDLGPDGAIPMSSVPSVAALATRGESTILADIKHGMAWAARRDVLQRHGLYDSCVIGGGDTALMRAAYDKHTGRVVKRLQLFGRARDHYVIWANGFHDEVRGRVGVLPGSIHHLWHGDLENRRYQLRHSDLARHDFDPWTDIRLSDDGAWRWASDKPALHALLSDYFHSRQDDGSTAGVAL
jgi:hypothetical protein